MPRYSVSLCAASHTQSTPSDILCRIKQHLVMRQASECLDDDYRAAFVRWLTTRTLEGRVRWEKQPNGFIGHLNGSVFAQFVTHCSRHGQAWRFFTVRDSNVELLQAMASRNGVETAPVAVAIQVLFCTILWAGLQLIH